MRSGFLKNSVIYLLVIAAIVALVLSVVNGQNQAQELEISELAKQLEQRPSMVEKITIQESGDLVIDYLDSSRAEETSRKETDVSLFETMTSLGVSQESLASIEIEVEPDSVWSDWLGLIITVIPLLIFGALLFFMVRQAQGSNSQAMNFGKSKAKMFTGDKPTVTFDDVAGADEAKEELNEVVEFLREPEKFISLGREYRRGS